MPTNSNQSLVVLEKACICRPFFYGREKSAQERLRQRAQALLIGDSHSGEYFGCTVTDYYYVDMQPALCSFATVSALLPEPTDDCRNSTAGIRYSGHDMHCL